MIDGSYIYFKITYDYDLVIDEPEEEVDALYIMEFDVNKETYHFDMNIGELY